MNLLSHALLAQGEKDDVLTVNVLWDFLAQDMRQDPRPFVRRGSAIHRIIDQKTDTSEEFAEAMRLVSEKRRFIASIVVDVALDYALSQDWQYYFEKDRLGVIEAFYQRMSRAAPSVGEEAESLVARMRKRNWFKSYGEIDGLKIVFQRMSERNHFLDSIIGAEEEVESRLESYIKLMRSLYPKVKASLKSI